MPGPNLLTLEPSLAFFIETLEVLLQPNLTAANPLDDFLFSIFCAPIPTVTVAENDDLWN